MSGSEWLSQDDAESMDSEDDAESLDAEDDAEDPQPGPSRSRI